jgi:hypothetical protein
VVLITPKNKIMTLLLFILRLLGIVEDESEGV